MKKDMGLDPELMMESLNVNLAFVKDEELMKKIDEIGGKDAGIVAVMAATFTKYYLENLDCPGLLDTFDLPNDKVREAGKLGIQKAFKDLIDLDKVLNIGEHSHIKSEEQKAEIVERREEFRNSDNKDEILDKIFDEIVEDLLAIEHECDCANCDEDCEHREEEYKKQDDGLAFKIMVIHDESEEIADVKFEKILDLNKGISEECEFKDIPRMHQDKIMNILKKSNREVYDFITKNIIDERVVTGSFKKYSEVKEGPVSLSIWDKLGKKKKRGGIR